MKEAFGSRSIESCLRMMEEKLRQLEISPIDVAVIGNSAAGKSSFINAIRSLDADDTYAAPVGEFQSTPHTRYYLHPRVPEVKFWDLPGVGSMQFPKETYLSDVSFDQYDFFILITAERFTQNDVWLGSEIQKREKKYFFVRTHIDKDISNDRKAHPNSHNEDQLLNTIRNYTVEKLKEYGSPHVPVFLVSNFDRTKYDFHRIEQKLIEELPVIRKNVILLYKSRAIRGMIEATTRRLGWLLLLYSALSAATSSVPNYFVSAGIIAVLAIHCSNVCFKQFGLGATSLEHYARITSVSSRKLKEIVHENFEERQKKTKRLAAMAIGIPIIPAFTWLAKLVLKRYSPLTVRIISVAASFVSAGLCFGYVMGFSKNVAVKIADATASDIRQ